MAWHWGLEKSAWASLDRGGGLSTALVGA
jgi:hypothetical protein